MSVVISRYGRKVKSAGFMIYFGSPSFFVEATDSLMLERRQRILQSFAGPFTELVIAGAAVLVVFAFPGGPLADLLYKFALLNYLVIFLNLIPHARARRLLDPVGPDPGPRPPTSLASVHAARPLAQAPDPRAA